MPHDVHGHARAVRVRLLVAAAVDHGARVAEQDAVGGEHAVQVAHLHGDVVGIVDADGDADAEPDGDVDAEHVLFDDDHANVDKLADPLTNCESDGDYHDVADDNQNANSLGDADSVADVNVNADGDSDTDEDADVFQFADDNKHDVADINAVVHAHAVADAFKHNYAYTDSVALV